MNKFDDAEKLKFIQEIINRVFESELLGNVGRFSKELEAQAAQNSTLLRAINYGENPLEKFK